jgi:hypothetical protein
LKTALSSQHQSGETMAGTRTRLDPALLALGPDMLYSDAWADTTQSGVTARSPVAIRYTGNANPADDLATLAPANGIINYPQHIQPLWTRDRGANTCTGCHSDPTRLDLSGTHAGTGRLASYERLMIGDPDIDADTGLPKITVDEGVPMIVRLPALVDTMASEGEALGLARKSRLADILFGERLMSGDDAVKAHPNPPAGAPDHGTLLNPAEKRLVAEWIDLGGKYYNDPFDPASGLRTVNTLSRDVFDAQVYPILQSTCAASCHQAIGSTAIAAGTSLRQNRFVLTGDGEGDFNVTLTMVSNTCNPAANLLLMRPSTVPHPAGAAGQASAVLPAGSANYTTLFNWIASGGC